MNKSVLICEDDEGIIDVAKIVLQEKGYSVTSLTNCSNIMDILPKVKPDVILLDLWMPDLNGEEVAAILKSNDKTRHIPIIMVSANKDLQKIAMLANADDYLAKPFDITDLENIVDKHAFKVS
jgi:CheY-like chemotaxis protein